MNIRDYLEKLTDKPGVSGAETELSAALELLKNFGEAETDALGNTVGRVNSGGDILIDAHADRIGLIVTGIDKTGFLRVDACGGADRRVLPAAEVTVWGKRPVAGVITSVPPHLAKGDDANNAPEFENIFVDTGLDHDKAAELIAPGDRISVNGPLTDLANGFVAGAALDDRLGIAVLLRALELLAEKGSKVGVDVLFSAQEETGGSGAKTGAFRSDAPEAIAVDVSFAWAPGIKDSECGKFGEGPMIGFAPCLSKAVCDALVKTAKDNGIPCQIEVMGSRTGTNADNIAASKEGKRVGLVSVPIRNMHTQGEIALLEDCENAAELIAAYIAGKEAREDA